MDESNPKVFITAYILSSKIICKFFSIMVLYTGSEQKQHGRSAAINAGQERL